MDAPGSGSDAPGVGFTVVAGSPTAEELAAVVAVLGAAAEQEAERGAARVDADPRRRWDASARGIPEGLPAGRSWR